MKSRMNNTNIRTLNIRTRTVLVYKLYFLLLRNKISLQSVENLNRTFFFSPSSFSVVLRHNQWSKGIVSGGGLQYHQGGEHDHQERKKRREVIHMW